MICRGGQRGLSVAVGWKARDGRLGEARVCVDQMQIFWEQDGRRGGQLDMGPVRPR
jgi:hypothetical protein